MVPNVAAVADFYSTFDAGVGLDGASITDDDVTTKNRVGSDSHRVFAVGELDVAFEYRSGMDHGKVLEQTGFAEGEVTRGIA